MASSFRFGLSEVHYATFTYDDTTGTYLWDTPKKIMCAISMELSAVGEEVPFYCDNKIGFTAVSNQGYEGTLTGNILSTSFRDDVLGEVTDDNGVRLEFSNVQPKPFALLYQVEGDETATRFVFYNCTATRPGSSHNTNTDTIAIDEQELSFSAKPRTSDYLTKAYIDEGSTEYDEWYNAVYEPVITVPVP